jgi:hypothetical protein
MTEADWLTDTNPAYLMRQVRSRPWRKRCLYICACWGTVRDLLISENSRTALQSLQALTEAEPPFNTFVAVEGILLSIGLDETQRAWHAPFTLDGDRLRAADLAAGAAGDRDDGEAYQEWNRISGERKDASDMAGAAWNQLGRGLCGLARCVFGNPFRPAPAVDPAWLTWNGGTVRKLTSAYADALPESTLEPAQLTVLADALEDAGCTDAELLSHLRGRGPHVRGCWALDLVLGKK